MRDLSSHKPQASDRMAQGYDAFDSIEQRRKPHIVLQQSSSFVHSVIAIALRCLASFRNGIKWHINIVTLLSCMTAHSETLNPKA